MSQDLILKCECGSLSGKVRGASAKSVNRLVCHCTDCQAFARYLGAPERVLDQNGGSDICQTSMARVSIDQGKEHLAVMRLSPKGLLRWHSRCCRTVIANTLAKRGLPFVGLYSHALSPMPPSTSLDDVVGPSRGRVNLDGATGDVSALQADAVPLWRIVPRFAGMMIAARLRGEHKRSEFFDESGAPVVSPDLVDQEQKATLYS